MKKIFSLVIVSSLLSVGAFAKVGEQTNVNCKDVLAKVKRMNDDKKAAGSGAQNGDSGEQPAKEVGDKEAK